MPLTVPSGDAIQAGPHEGALAGAVEVGVEERIVGGGGNAATLALQAPKGSSACPPPSTSSRTYHSRLAAEIALGSIAISRSGAKRETMKMHGSTIGSQAMTWLMLQIPR